MKITKQHTVSTTQTNRLQQTITQAENYIFNSNIHTDTHIHTNQKKQIKKNNTKQNKQL